MPTMEPSPPPAPTATVVVVTTRFADDLEVLTDHHGFRVESIFPADAPHTAVVSSAWLRLRLESGKVDVPATIHLDATQQHLSTLVLPGGTRIVPTPDLTKSTAEALATLDPAGPLVVTHPDGSAGVGRAGMRYRDLLPERWGGRYIVSHITIPDGGPVPDYVHYHRIDFQMIFVKAGWVKVVYEDQGDPFVMHTGDGVLQPPQIRHRVLEASPGLEVIEIGTPALHETIADWSLELPNGVGDPARTWSGQRFVHHRAEGATYQPWINPKWVYRDTGIGEATGGVATAIVARPGATDAPPGPPRFLHHQQFASLTVLAGEVTAQFDESSDEEPDRAHRLQSGANVALPPDTPVMLRAPTPDCELLVVTHRMTPNDSAET